MSHLLAHTIASNQKKIILPFLGEKSIELLEKILKAKYLDDAKLSIVTKFAQLRPNQFKENVVSHLAFFDACQRLLVSEPGRFVILLDDIDHYKTFHNSLFRVVELGIRLIVVGRMEINFGKPTEHMKKIVCSPWKRNEAKTILQRWIGDSFNIQREQVFESRWIGDQSTLFSLYLLRLLAEQFKIRDDTPEVLLKRIIRPQLQNMDLQLKSILEVDEDKATYIIEKTL